MTEIDIQTITSKSLREGKFSDVFREYYDLARVTENSLWHDNQNVLDHVIGVFEGLETVLSFEGLDQTQADFLKGYLSEKIENLSRKEALIVATLLHDIAKIDTLVKSPDGTARCPGHELIAASRVGKFSERFGLGKRDEKHVENIVRYHGLISDFLTLVIANGKKERYLEIFKETVGDVAIELVLLMRADLLGSDLEKGDKKAYDDRMDILSFMLKALVNSKAK